MLLKEGFLLGTAHLRSFVLPAFFRTLGRRSLCECLFSALLLPAFVPGCIVPAFTVVVASVVRIRGPAVCFFAVVVALLFFSGSIPSAHRFGLGVGVIASSRKTGSMKSEEASGRHA